MTNRNLLSRSKIKVLTKVYGERILVLILLVLIVVSPWISSYHGSIEPVVIIESGEPMPGSVGSSIESSYCVPVHNVILYNVTMANLPTNWRGVDQSGTVELSKIDNRTGSTTYQFNQNSVITFRDTIELPVTNYSKVVYYVDMEVISGSVDISVSLWSSWVPHYYNGPPWVEIENHTVLDEGESGVFSLNIDTNDMFNMTSRWLTRLTAYLRIRSTVQSEIEIGRIIVSAESEEPLYPVTFDFRDPGGTSLFPNLANRSSIDYVGYFSYERYPGLKLTRTGNATDSSIFQPRFCNQTLFLPQGEYSGTMGWFFEYTTREPDYNLDFSFAVATNESYFVSLRIPIFRLFLDVFPSFAVTRITFTTEDNLDDYPRTNELDFPIESPIFFYVRPGPYAIKISPINRHYLTSYSYFDIESSSIPSFIVSIAPDSEHSDLYVSINYTHVDVFGLVMDFGMITAVIAVSFLLILLIRKIWSNKSYTEIRTDRKTQCSAICIVLYYISAFTPWIYSSFSDPLYAPMPIDAYDIVPLSTTIWKSTFSTFTIIPPEYLINDASFLGLPLWFLLFWAPFLYINYLLATRKEPITAETILESGLTLTIILVPLLLGLFYLLYCLLGYGFPSIGLFATLAITPTWLLTWKYVTPSSNEQVNTSESMELQKIPRLG